MNRGHRVRNQINSVTKRRRRKEKQEEKEKNLQAVREQFLDHIYMLCIRTPRSNEWQTHSVRVQQ